MEKRNAKRIERALFVERVFLVIFAVVLTAGGLFILSFAAEVFLLLFAGILCAILLRGIISWVRNKTGLSLPLATVVVFGILALMIILAITFSLPTISRQFTQMIEIFPQSVAQTKEFIMKNESVRNLMNSGYLEGVLPNPEILLRKSGLLATSMLGGLLGFLVVMIIGLYLALDPRPYIEGFLRLFPIQKRNRVCQVLCELEVRLGYWLIGKFFGMLIIGVMTWIGLWILGIPMALLLGVIAGSLTFIPNIGPILSAIPSLLFAFTFSPEKVLYVILLFAGTQFIETYFITPNVEKRMISIPQAVLLFAQLLMGLLLGFMGLALATPLTVVLIALIEFFYMEDVLGEKIESKAEEACLRDGKKTIIAWLRAEKENDKKLKPDVESKET